MTATGVLGKGLYRIPEASRLTGVHLSTLKTWLRGRTYKFAGRTFTLPAKWETQISPESASIGFLDLIEARIIGKFRRKNVKWSTIAAASIEAKKSLGVSHPFATRRLITNGQRIFLNVAQDAKDFALIEIAQNQRVFDSIIEPFLIDLDFDDDVASRWWPLGTTRQVVLDPQRHFGRPIVNVAGIPTAVLARAVKAEGSSERVAAWYEVPIVGVNDAVEFEEKIAARKLSA